jgi:ABC-type sugar transport system permease subunit
VISLALAQLLNARFPGRRLVRWALIVPWAASLIMTSKLFVWIYDYYFGLVNPLLQSLGIIAQPVDWLGDDATVMGAMIAVGVFVSLPFTTYVFLAGLQSIPGEVYEAARVDGASTWRTYRSVTLPLLRPALLVAVVLNVIYVFNSFPIVWTLNDRNPGFAHDTMITYMYKIAFKSALRDVGMAAALGVVNVGVILLAVVVYLRTVRWQEEVA